MSRRSQVADLALAAALIRAGRDSIPASRAMLVGLTGIDGCGKGYLAARIVSRLRELGLCAADINVDGWLNLPQRRFDAVRPAEHFHAYRQYFDLTIWIECSFETALERALQRRQEGLTEAETIHAYETIYFPAQRRHFELDRPREAADLILVNDPRIADARGADSSSQQGMPGERRRRPAALRVRREITH